MSNNFFFCGWCDMFFISDKQKQQSKCYTQTDSGPKKCSKIKKCDVGPERFSTRTWTCTNMSSNEIKRNQFRWTTVWICAEYNDNHKWHCYIMCSFLLCKSISPSRATWAQGVARACLDQLWSRSDHWLRIILCNHIWSKTKLTAIIKLGIILNSCHSAWLQWTIWVWICHWCHTVPTSLL